MSKKNVGITTPPAYDMPPPNSGLPYRDGLSGLARPAEPGRLFPMAFERESGRFETFLDPSLIERFLDVDPRLRGAASVALDRVAAGKAEVDEGRLDRDLKTVYKHLDRIFEDVVMIDLLERWERLKPLLARYVLAKEAVRRVSPGRLPEPDDEDDAT